MPVEMKEFDLSLTSEYAELGRACEMDRPTDICSATSDQCALCWYGNRWHHDWDRHLSQTGQAFNNQNWVSESKLLSII